jgi:hypothetical protein
VKRRPTKRSQEGAAALRKFKEEQCANDNCQLCGSFFEQLDPHHIVYRRGQVFDDERNLLAVCPKCHMRIHGATLVFRMGRYDPIPLKRVLEAKRDKDPEYWDLAFLRELSGRRDFGEGLE